MIQGDVFCFTKLEEALIDVNFVIEAVHEDLEDKKSLLESKTIITQQFLSTYRVAQQCCPGRNCPEIHPETSRRVLRSVFWGVSRRFLPGDPRSVQGGRGRVSGGSSDFRQDNIAAPYGIINTYYLF